MNLDRIFDTFNQHGVAYLLIGGMNFMLRHQPILTFDVGLWIDDRDDNRARCELALAALDAYDGRRVATYELPSNHRFASPALVASGDRIAIARKGYDDREAALVLLRLKSPPPAAPPAPVPYNGASPAQTGLSGR
jgi:hypothetical protein